MPYERIRYTDRFDDPNLPGELRVTVTLAKVSCGTALHVVQEGVPAVIPEEACYLGWQELLLALAGLVEAEITGWRAGARTRARPGDDGRPGVVAFATGT
jgi:hypothetical protein